MRSLGRLLLRVVLATVALARRVALRRSCADMNRVLLLSLVFASLVAAEPSQVSRPDFRLQIVPAIVYKVDDAGGARTSSFVFDIAVICSTDCALTPISASVELSSAGSTIERQGWTTAMLAKIKNTRYRIEPRNRRCVRLRCPKHLTFAFIFAIPRHWRLTSRLSG